MHWFESFVLHILPNNVILTKWTHGCHGLCFESLLNDFHIKWMETNWYLARKTKYVKMCKHSRIICSAISCDVKWFEVNWLKHAKPIVWSFKPVFLIVWPLGGNATSHKKLLLHYNVVMVIKLPIYTSRRYSNTSSVSGVVKNVCQIFTLP